MEASSEEQVNHELYWESKISEEFFKFLKLKENSEEENGEEEEREDGEEEEEEEEEFSFVFGGEIDSSIAAEDAFSDGRIKAVFPLYNRDLVFGDSDSDSLPENQHTASPVRKVFVETEEDNNRSAPENDAIEGPYCEWTSRKAVEVSSSSSTTDVKKSNSTGFSKIWRFKEFRERCHSDGRDAFVFLNKSHAPPKQKAAEETVKVAGKAKKGGNKKKASSHEVYLMSKAKDDRRRTFLPYRPELMGFFTNVSSGGLTRNVHPY